MKWFVIVHSPYHKYGPFNDQVSAKKFSDSLGRESKIICKNF